MEGEEGWGVHEWMNGRSGVRCVCVWDLVSYFILFLFSPFLGVFLSLWVVI